MCAYYPQESRKNDGQLSKSAHGPTSAGLFFSAQALSRGFLRDASVTTAEPAIFEFVINLKTAKALAEEATQVIANTAAKTRCMAAFLALPLPANNAQFRKSATSGCKIPKFKS
jgi:hypothetical protein